MASGTPARTAHGNRRLRGPATDGHAGAAADGHAGAAADDADDADEKLTKQLKFSAAKHDLSHNNSIFVTYFKLTEPKV